MRGMPRHPRRQHKSTGIDVEKSYASSHARIDKRGKLVIRTQSGGEVKDIPANKTTKAVIGAGVWLGETIRRDGMLRTVCICYRTSGKRKCKATRKVKSAIAQTDIVIADPLLTGTAIVVLPIKSGNVNDIVSELRRSEYLTPTNGANPRAWVQEGIIPRESSGNSSHEDPVPRLLPEYRKIHDDGRNSPQFTTAGSDVSPKRIDYSAGKNQPKATYGVNERHTYNELHLTDCRQSNEFNENIIVRTMRTPAIPDTEH